MGALIIALIPIIRGLIAGVGIGIILSGLTAVQWAGIAGAIAGILASPAAIAADAALINEVEAEFRKLHPAFDRLWADVAEFGPKTAAEKAVGFSWPTGQIF